LNWAGDFRTLEAHLDALLENSAIVGSRVETVVDELRRDASLSAQFRSVYGREPDRRALVDAILAHEAALLTPASRFGRWLEGDAGALSERERQGYAMFKSLGCVSCHQGVNVGGNLLERHGIFQPLAAPQPEILRVPSLRNVATTPPYFHDGSAPTL